MRQVSLALPGLHSSIVNVMAGLPVSLFFSQVPTGESAAAAGDAPISDTSDANITITTVSERAHPIASIFERGKRPSEALPCQGSLAGTAIGNRTFPRHGASRTATSWQPRDNSEGRPLSPAAFLRGESRMPNYHRLAPSRASRTPAACETRESEVVPRRRRRPGCARRRPPARLEAAPGEPVQFRGGLPQLLVLPQDALERRASVLGRKLGGEQQPGSTGSRCLRARNRIRSSAGWRGGRPTAAGRPTRPPRGPAPLVTEREVWREARCPRALRRRAARAGIMCPPEVELRRRFTRSWPGRSGPRRRPSASPERLRRANPETLVQIRCEARQCVYMRVPEAGGRLVEQRHLLWVERPQGRVVPEAQHAYRPVRGTNSGDSPGLQ